MPVYRLDDDIWLPRPELADPETGLVAVGGDLRPERLLLAYGNGIFPWPHEGMPMLWFSPDPREVIAVEGLRVPRSLAKVVRRKRFRISFDRAFARVMAACSTAPRPGNDGVWITGEMQAAYGEMHRLGFAHSIEAWEGDELVGGLYGMSLGGAFFGESMFAAAPDASKVAFVTLVTQLRAWGFHFVDCQVHSAHVARFGSESWPRPRFLAALKEAMKLPTRPGPWELAG